MVLLHWLAGPPRLKADMNIKQTCFVDLTSRSSLVTDFFDELDAKKKESGLSPHKRVTLL